MSSSVEMFAAFATGLSLTGFMVILTVAVFELMLPSLTLKEKESEPEKSLFGVYVKCPSAEILTVPLPA